MIRNFGTYQFQYFTPISLKKDGNGNISEYSHKLPPGVQPNKYALGPFCKFNIERSLAGPGVYSITVDGNLKYIGECDNLPNRFGPNGYGYISERNCHSDGQSTNCKINALILSSAKENLIIEVWFYPTSDRKKVEGDLISQLNPPWNGRLSIARTNVFRPVKLRGLSPSVAEFQRALEEEFEKAKQEGKKTVKIKSGDLHRKIGGYPGRNHRMPLCCQVMDKMRCPDDIVLEKPPSGKGATLIIEYRIPRSL